MKKISSMEFHILTFLHNYSIMHDIKKILKKNNQTMQVVQKNF
jgi:hypothetical protein